MTLYDRERPYVEANRASILRKGAPPKDLLGWFLAGFLAEVPARVHARGTWADRAQRSDPEEYQAVGGSLLGTPATSDGWRAYIEGDPRETELARLTDAGVTVATKAYRMPMRAAMQRLAGYGDPRKDQYPFMARLLWRIALMDGDVDAACASVGIIEPVRAVYAAEALRRLWMKYEAEPRPKPMRVA